MTDTPQPGSLDGLISEYQSGIANVQTSDPSVWLNRRSEIEAQAEQLSREQLTQVEKADRDLIAKADDVIQQLNNTGKSLAELRAGRPSDQWWWYLDVLSPIGDYYKAKPPSQMSQLFNIGFTVVQVAVLLVALFLIGRNLGIIPTPVAPTNTPRPSSTPAPTETINPQALDIQTAQDFKGANNVITAKLPGGWTSQQGRSPEEYLFQYGDPQNPSVVLQVTVGTADSLYSIIGISTSPASPKDALEEFKKTSQEQQSGFQLKDVTPAKIGNLEGFGLEFTISAGSQSPEDSYVILRFAPAQSGKMARLVVQARQALYDTFKPVIDAIIDSITINANNIPTATPTATLHPLLMTATAVQTQILALTPSPTPTATPTITPVATGEATAAATSAATSEATAASTEAATAAATEAATPAQ